MHLVLVSCSVLMTYVSLAPVAACFVHIIAKVKPQRTLSSSHHAMKKETVRLLGLERKVGLYLALTKMNIEPNISHHSVGLSSLIVFNF